VLALCIVLQVYLNKNNNTYSAVLSILDTINAAINPKKQIPTDVKRGAPIL